MIKSSFLPVFAGAFALLMICFLAVTLIVNPYGVSPLAVSWQHINRYKPARIDIDRLIKPYEVWRYQPKTVLMGTSRIQQGFDPAVFDGSRFAPAYNASIPASTVRLNVENLRQYVALDKNIKAVFLEVFFYQFIKSESGAFLDRRTKPSGILEDGARLFLSWDVLEAAVKTASYNLGGGQPVQEISPGGQFYYPPGHDSKGGFDGFAAGIWRLHETRPRMQLDDRAFQALSEFIETCKKNHIELKLLLTPNHVYDDYYIGSIHAWGKVQTWLERVTTMAPVVSFSQPGKATDEVVTTDMQYWNDPYHFKLDLGRMVMRSLLGQPVPGMADDFKVVLTPSLVAEHVAKRRAFAEQWAKSHQEFVAAFNRERQKWLASRESPAIGH